MHLDRKKCIVGSHPLGGTSMKWVQMLSQPTTLEIEEIYISFVTHIQISLKVNKGQGIVHASL